LPNLAVELVRPLDLRHVHLHAKARFLRHLDHALHNLERLFRQMFLVFLPDPVSINRSDVARSGGSRMGKHRKRDIEVVV